MRKLYTNFSRTIFAAFLTLLTFQQTSAQDIRGTEFWFSNTVSNVDLGQGVPVADARKFFMISYYDCTVTIDYPNHAGAAGANQTVNLTAGQRTIVTLANGFVDQMDQVETKQGNAVHVTSTQPIALYSIYYEQASSEVCPVYPVERLGKEYWSIAWKEDWRVDSTDLPFDAHINIAAIENGTVITFTNPSYTWTSTTNGAITHLPNASWTVTLNKGQTYSLGNTLAGAAGLGTRPAPAGYAKPDPANFPTWYFRPGGNANVRGNNTGLNSIRMVANKPFVAIGGTAGTNLGDTEYPDNNIVIALTGCGAADMTYSMLMPTDKWGTTHATSNTLQRMRSVAKNNNPAEPGFPNFAGQSSIADYLLIMSNSANNTVTITGRNLPVAGVSKTLGVGEFWFFESASSGTANGNITNPGAAEHVINSTAPVQVAQFQKGWQCDALSQSANNKDPGQMAVIDKQYWRGDYITTNPTDPANAVAYTDNFLVLLTDENETPRATIVVTLNNLPITLAGTWAQIPNTSYWFYRLAAVPNGASIRMFSTKVRGRKDILKYGYRSPFAYYVSGAGGAGSYGFMGGTTCGAEVFANVDSVKHRKIFDPIQNRFILDTINVCNGDTAFFRVDSTRNGVFSKTAAQTYYQTPTFRWIIDINGNGVFNIDTFGVVKDAADIVLNATVADDNILPDTFYVFKQPGRYYVMLEAVDVAGCYARDTFYVDAYSNVPKPTITGPAAVCPGDSIVLTADDPTVPAPGKVRFKWYEADNLTVCKPPSVVNIYGTHGTVLYDDTLVDQPIANRLYIVKGYTERYDTLSTAPLLIDTLTCFSDSTGFQGRVISGKLPAPEVKGKTKLCPSDKSTTLTAVGSPGATYRWYTDADTTKPGVKIYEGKLDSIKILSSDLDTGDNHFFVFYTSKKGCESEFTDVNVVLNRKGQIDDPLTTDLNGYICFGQPDTFDVSSNNAGAVFTWYSSFTAANEDAIASGSRFITPPLKANKDYWVQAFYDGCISDRVKAHSEVVNPIVPFIPQVTICSDNNALLVATEYDPGAELTWYEPDLTTKVVGSTPNPSTDGTFTTKFFEVENDSIVYYYVRSNFHGCLSSDFGNSNIVINEKPSSPKLTKTFTCYGTPFRTRITDPVAGNDQNGDKYNYEWFNQQKQSVVGDPDNPNYDPEFVTDDNLYNDTLIYVVISNINTGCVSDTLPVPIEVIPEPKITSIDGSRIICAGTNTTLQLHPSVYEYAWYKKKNSNAKPIGNPFLRDSIFNSPVLNSDTTYYVIATDLATGCKSDTVNWVSIDVQPTPIIDTISGNTACEGSSAILMAHLRPQSGQDATQIRYTWYTSAGGSTPIEGAVEKVDSTLNTGPLNDVETKPSYYVEAINVAAKPTCKGPRKGIDVIVSPRNLPAPNVSCGREKSNSIEVIWAPVAGAYGYEVSGDNVNFFGVAGGDNAQSYTFTGLEDGKDYNFYVRALKDNALTNCGSTYSATTPVTCRTVNCGDSVILDVTPSDTLYLLGSAENIYVEVVDIEGDDFDGISGVRGVYKWSIPVSCDSCPSPKDPLNEILRGIDADTYTIWDTFHYYRGSAYEDCPAIYGKVVLILKSDLDEEIKVPEVFNPNGLGYNTTFGADITKNILNYNFTVYNRWGERVFESVDVAKRWNGTVGNVGEAVPQGIYVWVIQYKTLKGERKSKTGFVSLNR